MAPKPSSGRADHAAVDGAPGASPGRGSHDLHTALQSALQLLRASSANVQSGNPTSLTALCVAMEPLRQRVHTAALKAPAERLTPAELDELSALLRAGPPVDACVVELLDGIISTKDSKSQEAALAVAAGRLQQLADSPDLLAAAFRLALDTSRCGRKQQREMDRMQQVGADRARWLVNKISVLDPQRLLRLPGGSGLPAAFAWAAAAEGRDAAARRNLRQWLDGIYWLTYSLLTEHAAQLQAGQQAPPVAAAAEVMQVPGFKEAIAWSLGEKELCTYAAGILRCLSGAMQLTDSSVVDGILAAPGLLTALLALLRGTGGITSSGVGSSVGSSSSGQSGGGSSRASGGGGGGSSKSGSRSGGGKGGRRGGNAAARRQQPEGQRRSCQGSRR